MKQLLKILDEIESTMTLKEIYLSSCKQDLYNQHEVSKLYDQIGEEPLWKAELKMWEDIQRISPREPENLVEVVAHLYLRKAYV